MALVLTFSLQFPTLPTDFTCLTEVITDDDRSTRKYLDPFFREILTAVRQIVDRGDRSVFELQMQSHAITQSSVAAPHWKSGGRLNGKADQEPGQINKMAGFADDPATTNFRILSPVICRNLAGVDSDDDRFGAIA